MTGSTRSTAIVRPMTALAITPTARANPITLIGALIPFATSHCITVTLINPMSGPMARSTDPRPTMAIGVRAMAARTSGAADTIAPPNPAEVNS
jgi:hypothetical protein